MRHEDAKNTRDETHITVGNKVFSKDFWLLESFFRNMKVHDLKKTVERFIMNRSKVILSVVLQAFIFVLPSL